MAIVNSKVFAIIGLLLITVSAMLIAIYWQPYSNKTHTPATSPTSTLQPNIQTPIIEPTVTLPQTTPPSLSPSPSLLQSATPTNYPIITPIHSPMSTKTPPIFMPSQAPILPRPTTEHTPVTLYPGEVLEYQGQRLSSIGNFYENSIIGVQNIDAAAYKLNVFGLVNREIELPYYQIISDYQSFQKVVTIYCVDGWDATILWEGVLIKDLIQTAGANIEANTVIFHSSDGYTTSMPLEYLLDNDIIMAYKMNDIVIPPERGFPFQLVAESKYGYKWAKWIIGIELTNDPSYLGYWESRGYPNDANLP